MKQHTLIQTAIALAAAGTLQAGTDAGKAVVGKEPAPPATPEENLCDKIFGLATLYKDKTNPVIQELAITGRYHGQFYNVDDGHSSADDWENRRFRIGAKATVFNIVELKYEMFSNDEFDPFYSGITEAYVSVKPSDAFNITVGKQKPRFSLEWSTSSREILTFERSILTNSAFSLDYAAGVSVSGKVDKASYFAGVFNGNVDKEFGDLDGGWNFIASIGYDVADLVGTEKAVARLDYIHCEPEDGDSLFTKFENGLAASLAVKEGKIGLNAEVVGGFGDDSFVGFYLTPSYDITDKLQVVARYTFAHSGDNALSLQRRYEREVSDIGGLEDYNAGYLGLNYYLCGHKLKVMAGVEYANGDGVKGDYDGWTTLAGVRVYW